MENPNGGDNLENPNDNLEGVLSGDNLENPNDNLEGVLSGDNLENPNDNLEGVLRGDNLEEASSSNLENPNDNLEGVLHGDILEEANSSDLENPNENLKGVLRGDNLEEANSSNLENPNDNFEDVLQRWKILKQGLGSEIESELDTVVWWASFVAGWEEEVELCEKEIENRTILLNRAQTRSEADLQLREEALRRRERLFLHAKASKLEERPQPTYDVRTRPNLIEISSLSKDLQKVKIGLCVLASPGENFDERALLLIVNETMKTVVSQYNASQILTTERETVIKEVKDKLTERAINFKMVLEDVSITISLLTAVGPEYTLFVDVKIEKDNTSAIIRAQADETWNKCMNAYVFFLGVALTTLLMVRPLLPHEYDNSMLAGFAAVWGLGSVGLPLGMFGTRRSEKNISRHIGWFISLCFSLMVIYTTYLLVKPMDGKDVNTSDSAPAPPKSDIDRESIFWASIFGFIGFMVTVGHIFSWCSGCLYGGDKDIEPLSGPLLA